MSQTQVLEVVEIEPKRYTEIKNSKKAKTLGMSSLELYRILLPNGYKAKTLRLEDVPLVWRVCEKLGRGNLLLISLIKRFDFQRYYK